MLTRLRVKNFRLLRDVTIDLGEVTVLIGPNSAGKSTVLEVLDFLARCASGKLEDAVAAHGGMESIRTIGVQEPVVIETTWSLVAGVAPMQRRSWNLMWTFSLDRAQNGAPLVRHETLIDRANVVKPRSIVHMTADGKRFVEADADGEDPTEVLTTNDLAFHALRDPTRYPALHLLSMIVGQIRVLGSVTAAPLWARPEAGASARDSLVLAPAPYLGRQGLGLANTLYDLSTNHASAWSSLEQALRGEFPFVKRIVFPADPGGGKIAFAVEDERFPERKIYASEVSDGMIAFLVLLVAMLQPHQLGVLGLDEPDANVHPSALRRLLEIAQRPHERRHLVIVTHSSAVLDELRAPWEQLRVVESTRDGAVVRTLDAEALAAWRDHYALSELRRRGQIDASNASYASKRTTESEGQVAEPARNGSPVPAAPKKATPKGRAKGR
ncbi:MAG TPA: AAA family ATPase, partial [Polyangiaceae bacterium]|nr:AAA family ATPase [Polyangiaceae bacterium]